MQQLCHSEYMEISCCDINCRMTKQDSQKFQISATVQIRSCKCVSEQMSMKMANARRLFHTEKKIPDTIVRQWGSVFFYETDNLFCRFFSTFFFNFP